MCDKCRLQTGRRLIARFFYGEMQSNEETDQMRPEGQVSGWGGGVALVVETELRSKVAIGGSLQRR